MIHPNRSFALRGVVWYQGESNTPRAVHYHTVFNGLIRDWREQWGVGDLPFYFCQLASHHAKSADAGAPSTWAELRESQALALKLPATGMAVLVDIGEAGDIHPRNKADVGGRLARIALANAYGRPGAFSGPVFDSAIVEDGTVRVRFRATDGGLVERELPETYQPRSLDAAVVPLKRNAPFGKLEGFTICGEDGRWCWAGASIEGDEVVVSSPCDMGGLTIRPAIFITGRDCPRRRSAPTISRSRRRASGIDPHDLPGACRGAGQKNIASPSASSGERSAAVPSRVVWLLL
ncbi:sialate O-acetylesterase [Termitidicoccus mucosus]